MTHYRKQMPLAPRLQIALTCILLLSLTFLVASSGLSPVHASQDNGTAASFGGRLTLPVGSEPKAIAAADFNGDGFKDLVTANRISGNISILLSNGGGGFGAATNFATRLDPQFLAVGDFNNDGKADVVVQHGSFDTGNLSIHFGDGSGNLSVPTTFLIGGTPGHIAVGDFNEDGNSDLAVTNLTFEGADINNVYILLGTGTGTFGGPMKFPAGSRPRHVAVGDFNEDGNSDLAVADVGFNFNKISILLGTGTGSFGAPTQFAVGSSPISLAAGDFNKDGNSDLAVANTDSHNISILLGTGTGSFGQATNFTAGSSFPLSVIVGDYNNDGESDLAVGFNSSQFSVVSVLLGSGTGSFATPATFTVGAGPTELAGGDFNNDGQSDVAAANAQDNSVTVLLSPTIKASVNDVTVTEGTGGMTQASFTVTLSAASDQPISVAYSVEGITANNGDFNPAVSDLIIPAGNLSGTVTVEVVGDTAFETDETFRVILSSPRNTLLADDEGMGTIINDDPVPSVSINDIAILEGDSGTRSATFTVSLSNSSFQAVTVSAATADGTAAVPSDYLSQSGTVTINPGEASKTFAVTVNGDTVNEGDEDFFVSISNPVNASLTESQGRCVITNDDPKVRFDAASLSVTEGIDRSVVAAVTRTGELGTVTSVRYETLANTASSRSDFTAAFGTLNFAPNESSKSITILITDDAFAESPETFTIRLSNPVGGGVGTPSTVTVTINSNDAMNGPSPVKDASIDAQFFVRQHYADFLNRVPDQAGLDFWINRATNCGQQDLLVCRINVSAAFFLSIENQETGYLTHRAYKVAYGNLPVKPVSLTLREYLAGGRQIGDGVVVGTPGWEAILEANKVSFFNEFVMTSRFTAIYNGLTNAQFVDALNANAGGALSQAERDALVNSTMTRAQILRSVAEDAEFAQGPEKNRAFVLAQYFGYLRRNPDDVGFGGQPDPNFEGYNFWLGRLNQFNGNFIQAEMVKAFIQSIEYGERFGQ